MNMTVAEMWTFPEYSSDLCVRHSIIGKPVERVIKLPCADTDYKMHTCSGLER